MKENLTEASFQLFWKLQAYKEKELSTVSGKRVQVISSGEHNYGPGPDFLEACIRIGNEVHYGSIELHLRPKDWYTHNHHTDSLYDSVVLHIFPSQPLSSDFLTVNSSTNTIEMMMIQFNEKNALIGQSSISKPCFKTAINKESLFKQAEIANKYYLSNSASHLILLGDTTNGLEFSFKQSIILRIFELLGSPYQKEQGIKTGEILFELFQSEKKIVAQELIKRTGVKNWGLGKSIEKKISEAIILSEFIYALELPAGFNAFPKFFTEIKKEIEKEVTGVFWQQNLIRNIACLAAYTWASLIYQVKAMDYFTTLWKDLSTKLPNSIRKQVAKTVLESYSLSEARKEYPNFLLDQHKSFCSKGNCLACNFF